MDRTLRQFLEVATLKSISRAAEKLCLTQPALTHAMKKLADTLGVPLFNRTARGLELTEFGELLLEQALVMQRLHENTLGRIALLKEQRDHALRIGSGHVWWHFFLRNMLREYRQAHPRANIHVDVGNHLRQMDSLLCGDIDVFIGHEIKGLNPRLGAVFKPLFTSRNRFFVRRGHPLLAQKCTLDDLQSYPRIELTPDESRYAHFLEGGLPSQTAPPTALLTEPVCYRSNSVMICIDLVRDSNGILPFPGGMDGYFRAHNLTDLTMEQEDRQKAERVGVYLTRESNDDPRIRALLSLLKRHAA